ncbi:MAG: DUF3025 domain-containing protein [Burkholderiaceae bacterium]
MRRRVVVTGVGAVTGYGLGADTLWKGLVTRHPELQSSNQAETSSQIVRLSTKDLTPLPLMGIPGWWKGNADPCFYEDQTIFRASGARGKIR